MRRLRPGVWASAAFAIGAIGFAVSGISAATVMQMNLAELVQRADRIYRGTVVSATSGTVAVGGGELPIVTYRLQVEDVIRGDVDTMKGIRLTELRMLGKVTAKRTASFRSVSPLPEMPQLSVGQTYLVLTTRPSAIGLSTTVGMGQGLFRIEGIGKDETAVNQLNNSGLFRDMAPPAAPEAGALARGAAPAASPAALPYTELVNRIQALVRR
jgi:hypothetical protein